MALQRGPSSVFQWICRVIVPFRPFFCAARLAVSTFLMWGRFLGSQ
jgi:hypothetical protein